MKREDKRTRKPGQGERRPARSRLGERRERRGQALHDARPALAVPCRSFATERYSAPALVSVNAADALPPEPTVMFALAGSVAKVTPDGPATVTE